MSLSWLTTVEKVDETAPANPLVVEAKARATRQATKASIAPYSVIACPSSPRRLRFHLKLFFKSRLSIRSFSMHIAVRGIKMVIELGFHQQKLVDTICVSKKFSVRAIRLWTWFLYRIKTW
jgi:hypothetical protein